VAPLSLDAYAPILCGCIERIRPEMIVHRIMADTTGDHGLIAPDWSANKQGSIRFLHDYMDNQGVEQGRLWKPVAARSP
jgi:radical SAM superfamily enzyme